MKNELVIRKELNHYRRKEVKYANITDHPKTRIISNLLNISPNEIRSDHLKYYFTRHENQYNPFDRVKNIPINIDAYDYLGAMQDLSSYMGPDSYYSNLMNDEDFVSALSASETNKNKRINELNLSDELKDFVALSYVKYIIFAGRDGRTAEPFGELQILAILARLAAADGQFGVAWADARELLGNAFRREVLDDVHERTARANRR